MRRAPIVLTATVLGTAGVLLFKPLSTTSVASATSTDDDSSATTSTSAAASGSSSRSSDSSSSSASTPSPTSNSSSSSSKAKAKAKAKGGTYTGAAETTRFGTTQVKVTIAGGKITEIATVQLNEADPRSYQISVDAAPTLRSEVLQAQTAAVDTVSGATYTSDAYEASLQSALDKAGYTAPDGTKASTDVSNIEESGGFGR
jgi:uncharacterized protein with FMN-binding domain